MTNITKNLLKFKRIVKSGCLFKEIFQMMRDKTLTANQNRFEFQRTLTLKMEPVILKSKLSTTYLRYYGYLNS